MLINKSNKEELLNQIAELTDENEILNNTIVQLEKYKQRCKELENDNYGLNLDKQNLIGLRDALNNRIEEAENEIKELQTKISILENKK